MNPRRAALAAAMALALGFTGMGTAAIAANVNAAPISYLSGDQTQFSRPYDVTLDSSGNRYVADTMAKAVLVFAKGAKGNVAPARNISGANTGLINPTDVLVDAAGLVYVADGPPWSIRIFAPGANGNVAPAAVITGPNTGLDVPAGMALDSASRLYVANRASNNVLVFQPGATGNVVPLRVLAGPSTGLDDPIAVVIDAQDRLHVANQGGESVTRYPAWASGDTAPTRILAGAATGFSTLWDLALDSKQNLYVSSGGPVSSGDPSVAVFSPTALSGNTAPTTRLIGANTDLVEPDGIAVDSQHRVVVINYFGTSMITTYNPLVPLPTVPGAVRKLKVAGASGAAKRTISWKKPSDNGGTPLTGYRVTIKKGKKTLVTKTLRPSQTSFVVRRKKLAKGVHTVSVVAINRVGASKKAVASFRVVK